MNDPNTSARLLASLQIRMFDFDNTLVGLGQVVDWAQSRRELEPMLRAAGCPQELFVEFPVGNLGLYDAVLYRTGQFTPTMPARELLQRASNIIEYYELAGVDRAEALPGAVELLSELASRKLPVVVVTSNSSRAVFRWLARAHLVHTVRTVVGRDTLLPLKPAPDMVRRALEMCKVGPDAAVFVGDSEADLKAAKAAGVRFFAIVASREGQTRMTREGAAAVYASPAELLEVVRSA
jgi:HAD superfamily hydrolase (TIGR01509 family)